MSNRKTKYSRILCLAAGLALTTLVGCSNSNVVSDTTIIQVRTVSETDALADFDQMWDIINESHFDPDFGGVDWNAVRDELRPQAAQAQNRREIRSIMRDAVNRFGLSHFSILPEADDDVPNVDAPSEANESTSDSDIIGSNDSIKLVDDSDTDGQGDWDTGIDIRMIDGQAVVSAIRDQSPAQSVGVQTGWILTHARSQELAPGLKKLAAAVSDIEFDIFATSMILNNNLRGPENTSIDLTFIDGNEEEIELNIARAPMPGEFVKFGNLPPMSTHLDWSRNTFTLNNGQKTTIGVISFNIWMMPIISQFEKAIYELRDVDGLIIDLRGNTGGISGLAPAVGRFLVSEKGSLGTMILRGSELSFNITPVIVTTWGERIKPFAGPIAILIDSGTASTSEFFAGGLQSLERASVFGTRSAGMALPAGMDKLPSGDVLIHAIANYVTSTGVELEHDGVVPDHIVPLTRKDLLNGIDSPKHAAVNWIQQSTHE